MIQFNIESIKDATVRLFAQRIRTEFNDQVLLRGNWRFYQITFLGAVTNYKYPHKLQFIPTDVIQTSLTGAGSLTWNYASFDGEFLDITTTGACVVRAFIGRYKEGL